VVPAAPEAATQEAEATAALVDASQGTEPPADAALVGHARPEIVPAGMIGAEEAASETPPSFESAVAALLETTAAEQSAPIAGAMTPLEGAPAEPPAEAQHGEEAAGVPSRRYRFERRTPSVPHGSATIARTERLSGRLATVSGLASAPEHEPVASWRPAEGVTLESRGAPAVGTPTIGEAAAEPSPDTLAPALGGREAELATESVPLQAAETGTEAGEESQAGAAGHEAPTRPHRRRRRRARSSGEETEGQLHIEQPEGAAAATHPGGNGFEPVYAPEELEEVYPPYAPYVPGGREPGREPGGREQLARRQPAAAEPWSISQAQQQISQPASPFAAPEPSFARGFGPQPRDVAQPYHESLGRAARPEAPAVSISQIAQTLSGAIAQQTDRLIAELRRQVATPPAITVAMPATQSTERVGVFVDVANLLYSARNMRTSIDFGRLLEFLRGSRRLIRAHAYAPTSPEPNAEQAFLSAVKGVGYRITTKNYKTFASGAKKADLDLDMCMDIVRLVDAGAVDTLVLVSGDSDFLPVLEWASDKGVRIEVAAFEDAASAILRQSCDLFVNLSLVPDIRL
jgi:uncharacterized LabA/DUF88 family protein